MYLMKFIKWHGIMNRFNISIIQICATLAGFTGFKKKEKNKNYAAVSR